MASALCGPGSEANPQESLKAQLDYPITIDLQSAASAVPVRLPSR